MHSLMCGLSVAGSDTDSATRDSVWISGSEAGGGGRAYAPPLGPPLFLYYHDSLEVVYFMTIFQYNIYGDIGLDDGLSLTNYDFGPIHLFIYEFSPTYVFSPTYAFSPT